MLRVSEAPARTMDYVVISRAILVEMTHISHGALRSFCFLFPSGLARGGPVVRKSRGQWHDGGYAQPGKNDGQGIQY